MGKNNINSNNNNNNNKNNNNCNAFYFEEKKLISKKYCQLGNLGFKLRLILRIKFSQQQSILPTIGAAENTQLMLKMSGMLKNVENIVLYWAKKI